MSNASSNSTGDVPPTILFSDYIEMTYLAFVISIGVPFNIFILRRLLKELKKTQKDSVKAGFLLLKIHLNVSDLLILIVAMGKLLWLARYEWSFGDLTCRLYQFFTMFSLYVSSNIVVCIAIDRLRNVLGASKVHGRHKKFNPVLVMLYIAWMLAAVCSLPQLIVFTADDVYPHHAGGWVQCTDIWQMSHVYPNRHYNALLISEYAMNIHNISHLILVFWGPLLVLIGSYVFIATRLMQYSIKGMPGQAAVHSSAVQETMSMTELERHPSRKPSRVENFLAGRWKTSDTPPLLSDTNNSTTRLSIDKPKSMKVVIRQPAWRRQMRSKVFRTTLLVVLAHFLFWFPYNAMTIMKYINEPLHQELSTNANVFKALQFLITLINPFLYGFSN